MSGCGRWRPSRIWRSCRMPAARRWCPSVATAGGSPRRPWKAWRFWTWVRSKKAIAAGSQGRGARYCIRYRRDVARVGRQGPHDAHMGRRERSRPPEPAERSRSGPGGGAQLRRPARGGGGYLAGTVLIWERASSRELAIWRDGLGSRVHSVAFSRDGRFFAAGAVPGLLIFRLEPRTARLPGSSFTIWNTAHPLLPTSATCVSAPTAASSPGPRTSARSTCGTLNGGGSYHQPGAVFENGSAA